MDWKSVAIDKLTDYGAKRQAMEGIPLEIAQVESDMASIRGSRVDGTPVKGGNSGYEDRMLNCLAQKEELQRILERTQMWINAVDGALAVLAQDERRVLDRFYITGGRGAAEDLADEFAVDVKTIYARKDRALRKFTIALYGVTES